MKPPYRINCEYGGERIGVLAYKHIDGGICFLDVGWDTVGRSPFHILDGPFELKETPSGPVWQARNGDTVQMLNPEDQTWSDWKSWLDYLESPDGIGATMEEAISGCKSNGALIDQPL